MVILFIFGMNSSLLNYYNILSLKHFITKFHIRALLIKVWSMGQQLGRDLGTY